MTIEKVLTQLNSLMKDRENHVHRDDFDCKLDFAQKALRQEGETQMMKSKEDLLKQAAEAIKNCYWRKDLGGISICSFACLPCERTIDNGKCEVLIKMFKENQKEEQESEDDGTA